jgi:enterochelin esterase-like enzyme
MVPNDLCFSYRFIVKDTVSSDISRSVDHYNNNLLPTGEERNFSYSVLDLNTFNTDWNTKRYYDLNSKVDTIEYTDNIVAKNRNIYIYLPPNYDKNRQKPYPVIYLFDAFIYLNRVEVPNILDNLITEGKIEPMIAVLYGTYRNTRGILLPINFEFKSEFMKVIVPLIRKNYNISLNPKYNIIGGMSYGGLAATFIAFYHPNVFGKVLSQSGSFWRDVELSDSYGNEVRNDWMINQFIKEDKKPIDIFLDWGLQENMVLGSNRKMVRILNQKKYKFDYIEFNGWHDWSNSRKTFPTGLMYLLENK